MYYIHTLFLDDDLNWIKNMLNKLVYENINHDQLHYEVSKLN